MKRRLLPTIILVLICTPVTAPAEVPLHIGGFELGGYLSDHKDRVYMDSLLPLRQNRYLQEVETRETENFDNGLLWIGNCADPGRIVRIRLKYVNNSRKFYEELLKRYKQHFGEPDEWRGDPFRIVIAWKWSFTDAAGNRISMILQHNSRDEEESMGNSLKLTAWNLVDAERGCWQKKSDRGKDRIKLKKSGPPDWDHLIPR